MVVLLYQTSIHGWKDNSCLVSETTTSEGFQSHLTRTEEKITRRHGDLACMEEDKHKMCRMCFGVPQERLEEEAVSAASMLVGELKSCADNVDLQQGIQLHAHLLRTGLLESNVFVGNTLVTMYANCGSLAKAQQVFDDLPTRTVVSWNTLIAGYSHQGHVDEAFACLKLMQVEGFSPNSVTFVCILRACASTGAADKGEVIHAQVVRDKVLQRDVAVGAALVDMYAKCALLEKAQEVCSGLCARDVVSWNALIAGYTQHSRDKEALHYFKQMQGEGVHPDAITFTCVLKACANLRTCDKGQDLHSKLIKEGLLGKDIALGTALVDMYAKCGQLERAQFVFDELLVWNVVSWNALITGYAQHGLSEEVLKCFQRMQIEGFSPDAVTYVPVLNAYGSTKDADKGQAIHTKLVREGLLEKDIVVANALIDMYVKSGLLNEACEVLDALPVHNIVTWNALLAGYAQHGRAEEVGDCLKLIREDGLSPDPLTFAYISKAYGSIAALKRGQEMHAEIVMEGLLEKDMVVANGLVNMYANCGDTEAAQKVFESLQARDVVSWNALIGSYAQLGDADMVSYSLEKMIEEGIEPDPITFTYVLNTCSHRGLLDEGQMHFETISAGYGVSPTLEHHTCMVDLFGRAGLLEMAVALIREVPSTSQFMMWHALLGACRKWDDKWLGSSVSEHVVKLDAMDVAAYVCMSDL